jgi:hypothetical protein
MQIEAEISRGPIQFELAADADEDHNRRRCCCCCWRLIDTDGDGAGFVIYLMAHRA